MEEITDTLKDLKSNKASGLDKIKNEFIKAAPRSMHAIILNFANLMSKKGLAPKSWCQDLITPILKEGDKESPENYVAKVSMYYDEQKTSEIPNRKIYNSTGADWLQTKCKNI